MRNEITLEASYELTGNNGGVVVVTGECILDCTAAGPVDDAVDYWVDQVDWTRTSWDGICDDLAECGADWVTGEDLGLDRGRWLWLYCGTVDECVDPDFYRVGS